MNRRPPLLALLLLAAAAALPTAARAAAPAGHRVVVAVDTSGSMGENDPKGWRGQAGRQILAGLGAGDAAAVLAFADQPRVLAPLTPLADPGAREWLAGLLAGPGASGATDLPGALAAARALLEGTGEPAPGAPRGAAVFLTDGFPDPWVAPVDPATRQAFRDQVRQGFLALGERDRPAYVVAFGPQPADPFMRHMAFLTGGDYLGVPDREALAAVPGALLGRLAHREILGARRLEAGQTGTLSLDPGPGADALLVVAVGAGAATPPPFTLVRPDGTRVGPDEPGAEWATGGGYRLLRLAAPAAGAHTVQAGGPVTLRAWAQRAQPPAGGAPAGRAPDLVVEVPDGRPVHAGEPVVLSAHLALAGRLLAADPRLAGVICSADLAGAGQTDRTELGDGGAAGDPRALDGRFAARYTPARAGDYRVAFICTGLWQGAPFTATAVARLPVLPPRGVAVALGGDLVRAIAGTTTRVPVRLSSTSSLPEEVRLAGTGPGGLQAGPLAVTVPPGAAVDALLPIRLPLTMPGETFPVALTATGTVPVAAPGALPVQAVPLVDLPRRYPRPALLAVAAGAIAALGLAGFRMRVRPAHTLAGALEWDGGRALLQGRTSFTVAPRGRAGARVGGAAVQLWTESPGGSLLLAGLWAWWQAPAPAPVRVRALDGTPLEVDGLGAVLAAELRDGARFSHRGVSFCLRDPLRPAASGQDRLARRGRPDGSSPQDAHVPPGGA